MPFFSQFPKRDVKVEFTKVDANGSNIVDVQNKKIVDIFRHVDVSTLNSESYTGYRFYELKDGDRPDIISHKLYNTPDYYWTIFIVNDFLQSGFDSFFKSDQDLNRGVELEFEGLGALLFLPRVSGFAPNSVLRDTPAGLPLPSSEYSFVKLVNIANDSSAKAVKYDSQKLLLIVNEVSSSSFFADNPQLDDVQVDPTIDAPDRNLRQVAQYRIDISAGTTLEKQAWLTEFNQITSSQGDSTTYTEGNLNTFLLKSFNTYSELVNAPHHFKRSSTVDGEGELDEQIYAFEALSRGLSSIRAPITFRENENNKNEQKRQIVVVKPEFIDRFVDEYRELIRS